MSLRNRASAAYSAFFAPAKDAIKLREMPRAPVGPRATKKRRLDRIAFDYRRWTPPDVENALSRANGSGDLYQAAAIAAWVKSNPIVSGIMEGRTSTPWLPYGVKYSEAAAAWLKGTTAQKGHRDQIADPSELEAIAIDEYNAGYGGGVMTWNEAKKIPELMALDNAGFRYLLGEDRYQYHAWGRVFDVEPGNGIWVLKRRVKSDPWRDGAWHKLAYVIMDAVQGQIQRGVWIHGFSLPAILAKFPLGASDEQKAKFTSSMIGGALRAIGVTPGYDFEYKQSSAEGGQTFKDVEEQLERAASILIWGTVGLLAGGSGFSNSDLFAEQKAFVLGKESTKQAKFENDQIWGPVLDWAVKTGQLPKGAEQGCVEYNPETPLVVIKKAQAAKALVDIGYSQEEAQQRAGIEKQNHGTAKAANSAKQEIFAYHLDRGIFTMNEVREAKGYPPRDDGNALVAAPGAAAPGALPETREPDTDEPPTVDYAENMAIRMNERGDLTCPHGREKYCRSCGVRLRHEEQGGQWMAVWMPARGSNAAQS